MKRRYSISLAFIMTMALTCDENRNNPSTPDWLPPKVVAVYPPADADSVPRDAFISITFSEQIDSSKFTDTTFLIGGVVEPTMTFHGSSVVFEPGDSLKYDTRYSVWVSTDITDLAGNSMVYPYSWSFQTVPEPVIPVGSRWTLLSTNLSHGNNLHAVAWSGSELLVAARYGMYVSEDGSNWESLSEWGNLNAVVHCRGNFLSAGQYGACIVAVDWCSSTYHECSGSVYSSDIVCTDTMYVAVGVMILTSTDGLGWTCRWEPEEYLLSIAWSGESLVCTGAMGLIGISTDGVNWQFNEAGDSEYIFYDICWTGDQYVAVGIMNLEPWGVICTSADGQSWDQRFDIRGTVLHAVEALDTLIIAVGERGTVLTSTDGIDWVEGESGTEAVLRDISPFGDGVIVVGEGGTVLTSP